MTPKELALEIHELRRTIWEMDFTETTEWEQMPDDYRHNHMALANALLDRYTIDPKPLSVEQKREQVRKGNPDAVRYGGKTCVSIDPPTTLDAKGKTYKLR